MWNGLMWLRLGTSGSCEHDNAPFEFHKRPESLPQLIRLLASQEGLCFMG